MSDLNPVPRKPVACFFTRSLSARVLPVLAFGLLVLTMGGWSFSQEAIVDFQGRKGFIKKFGKHFELIRFVADGAKLKPVFDANSDSGRAEFSSIGNALGSHGSSSSASGNAWHASFRTKNCKAVCGFGLSSRFGFVDNDQFWVFVSDETRSESTLKVSVKESGQIEIDYFANRGQYLFRFRQLENGDVYCQELGNEFAFVGAGKTFDDFCYRHPAYTQKRLQPVFEYLGMGEPATRYSGAVAKKVINDLQPVSDSRQDDFQKVIAGLDAISFSERETATKSLEKNFSNWKDLIQSAIADDKFSIEIRSRLKKIFENSVTEAEAGDLAIAQKGDLQDDVAYLIWILNSVDADELEASADVRSLIVARVEKLTGQKHGDDLEKWNLWLGQQTGEVAEAPEPTMSDKQILSIKGSLEKNATHIGKLIKLAVVDGKLKLDRKHWASPFAGKTIKELNAEAKKRIKELNLPKSWFKDGGGYSIETTDFPQVLFEQMKIDNPEKADIAYYRGYGETTTSTFNRTLNGEKLEASLSVHKAASGGNRHWRFGKPKKQAPKPTFFELALKEKDGRSPRKFLFLESEAGDLLLSIDYPSKDVMIRILQIDSPTPAENEGVIVFDIRGPVVKRYVASSFAEFQKNEKGYYESLISPLLKKLNIEIAEIAQPRSEVETPN